LGIFSSVNSDIWHLIRFRRINFIFLYEIMIKKVSRAGKDMQVGVFLSEKKFKWQIAHRQATCFYMEIYRQLASVFKLKKRFLDYTSKREWWVIGV
jgi:hypothetical protein